MPLPKQREVAPEAIGRRDAVIRAAGVAALSLGAVAQPASAAPAIGCETSRTDAPEPPSLRCSRSHTAARNSSAI